MNNNQIMDLLTILLIVMLVVLFVLVLTFIILKIKTSKPKIKKKEKTVNSKKSKGESNVEKTYNKQSIFDFMEFDQIKDNMIIQKNGQRFLMVIECQGINYDLMSGLEKNSVEQGFLQFLNTLRYPIQIYVQTRSVNLTDSINKYNEKIKKISSELVNKQMEYNQKVRSGQYSEKDLEKEKYEIVRQKNLYEYGIDIVRNTEKMSLNRNILTKNYYVIISYFAEELGETDFDKDEITNLAFSELYTKAQTIVNSLSVCEIKGKVLNSMELTELLYIAYNRDESEIFNLKRALNSGYEDLYTTAPNVFDKRMKELDKKIEEDALRKANEVVVGVMEENEKERRARRREKELDKLINQVAMSMIQDNRNVIGDDVAGQALNKLQEEQTKEEGGDEDGKKTKRGRKPTKSI